MGRFKIGGIIAIIIFSLIICSIIASSIIFRKSLGLSHLQLGLLLLIKLSFVMLLIVAFVKQYKCGGCPSGEDVNKGMYDENYRFYKLMTDGGWTNFKYWYAAIAGDVINELLFALLLFVIPFPFMPKGLGRITSLLIKFGIYKISLILILGSPSYFINDYQYGKFTTVQHYELVITLLLAIIFFSMVGWEVYKQKTNNRYSL